MVLKKTKKRILIFIGVLFCVVFMILINFIPTFSLQTSDMKALNGDWVTVYYEKEEEFIDDVFTYTEKEAPKIAKKLGLIDKQEINLYIYQKKSTMQTKKYGYIALFMNLDWYVNDFIGNNVIISSPENKQYDKDIKTKTLHGVIHAYINLINPDVSLWLAEGTALYLLKGKTELGESRQLSEIPSYFDTLINSPICFYKYCEPSFAQTYIEYLDVTYGWEKVMQLIETENYEACFNKSQKEIFQEWINHIKSQKI